MNHERDDDSKDVKADRECSERKVRKEKSKKKTMETETLDNLPLMTGMPRGEQQPIYT